VTGHRAADRSPASDAISRRRAGCRGLGITVRCPPPDFKESQFHRAPGPTRGNPSDKNLGLCCELGFTCVRAVPAGGLTTELGLNRSTIGAQTTALVPPAGFGRGYRATGPAGRAIVGCPAPSRLGSTSTRFASGSTAHRGCRVGSAEKVLDRRESRTRVGATLAGEAVAPRPSSSIRCSGPLPRIRYAAARRFVSAMVL